MREMGIKKGLCYNATRVGIIPFALNVNLMRQDKFKRTAGAFKSKNHHHQHQLCVKHLNLAFHPQLVKGKV